jgi:dihydrofolate synthase/folylpolyglutamate synthase
VIGCSGEPAAVPWLAARARTAGVARLTVVDGTADVALAGAHQRRNAACALAVIDHLEALGALSAPTWVRAHGLATVRHPGRLERVGGILLDGAHNPHGAAALAAALADLPRPRTLILALSADKDVAAMLAPLVPVVDHLIATRYQQPRALTPAALASAARTAGFVQISDTPDLASALDLADGTVIVAGSLMLVGEARVLLMGAPADPMVVTDPAPP